MAKPVSTTPSLQDLIASNDYGSFFGVTQKTLDNVWKRLINPDRNSVMYISMEIGADPDVYNPVRDFLIDNDLTFSSDPALQSLLDKYLHGPQKIPNYSGGLGVLAGDTL